MYLGRMLGNLDENHKYQINIFSPRMDARTDEEKSKHISWTHALRDIVTNCYKFHGREDLLPKFTEEEEVKRVPLTPRKVWNRSVYVSCQTSNIYHIFRWQTIL